MYTKIRTLLIFIVTSSSIVFSQITINQSDYNSIFIIGETFTSHADTSAASVNIGIPGGGNNWDFSSYMADVTFSIDFISPAGTPAEMEFPGANLVGFSTTTADLDDTTTITGETWSYHQIGTPSREHGIFSRNTTVTTNTQSIFESKLTHFPPFEEYDFPVSFNKIWSSSDSTESESTLNGVPTGFASIVSSTFNFNVDAWGTMTMPGGGTFDALRLREQHTMTTYFAGFPISTSTSVTYSFLAKSGESFSILADAENPPNSGTIMGSIGWNDDSVTDVKEVAGLTPTEFSLSQNYPNPFNPSTIIEYSIPENSFVELKVYDILGSEVATLFNGEQNSGTYQAEFNAENLTSGFYIAQIKTENFVKSIKMVLVK